MVPDSSSAILAERESVVLNSRVDNTQDSTRTRLLLSLNKNDGPHLDFSVLIRGKLSPEIVC